MNSSPIKISSWRLALKAVAATVKTYGPILGRGLPLFIALQLLLGAGNQLFTYRLDVIQSSGREDLSQIALIATIELFFTMIWSSAWILTVATVANATGLLTALRPARTLNQLVIEQIRSLASVIWRTPLLLVPALIEYVRLVFVPLVVILDESYARGERDALRASREIGRGHFWLLSVTIGTSSLLPWVLEEIVQGHAGPFIWQNPGGVSLGWAVALVLNLATSVFLLQLFQNLHGSPRPRSGEMNSV